MSSKANSAAIRRRVGASAVPNISAPTPATNSSTGQVHIGDLIVSHDRALAELRRVVAEQAEQIAGLVDQVQLLTDGASVVSDAVGDNNVSI